MQQLFLTSSVHTVAADIANKVSLTTLQNKKCAFIVTPVEPDGLDQKWLHNDRQSLQDAGFETFDYTITDKNEQQLRDELADSAFIYVSGGNTYFMLQEAQKSGFIAVIKDFIQSGDKTYISTSSGSIVAGPDTQPALRIEKIEDAPDLDGFEGFNLVNFCVLPHWGSNTFRKLYLETRLEHAYKKPQVPLLLLTDTQYVWVQGDMHQIIDVR